jgi:adenosylcobinamide-phosphate synthase
MLEPVFHILMPDGRDFIVQAVLLAFVLDWIIGDPKWIYDRISHPVVWIGGLISVLEAGLRPTGHSPGRQIVMGTVLTLITAGLSVGLSLLIVGLAAKIDFGWAIAGVVGFIFLAARSLQGHVSAVRKGLVKSLAEGRLAVSMIVGRDPEQLDEAGVSRAALESLAENFSDGVVAPLFWFLLAGLPGLVGYKAINTLDSMIGHRNDKYLYFGRFAARLDDVVNWPASRITGGLICLAALVTTGVSAVNAWRAIRRDAGKHTSPNAGWPEAAFAGALGLALAGPRTYGAEIVDGAWMGDGRVEATADDIARGLRLYRITCLLIAGLLVLMLPW